MNMLLATIPTYNGNDDKDQDNEVEGIDELASFLSL
jgi:hypothetical protein